MNEDREIILHCESKKYYLYTVKYATIAGFVVILIVFLAGVRQGDLLIKTALKANLFVLAIFVLCQFVFSKFFPVVVTVYTDRITFSSPYIKQWSYEKSRLNLIQIPKSRNYIVLWGSRWFFVYLTKGLLHNDSLFKLMQRYKSDIESGEI